MERAERHAPLPIITANAIAHGSFDEKCCWAYCRYGTTAARGREKIFWSPPLLRGSSPEQQPYFQTHLVAVGITMHAWEFWFSTYIFFFHSNNPSAPLCTIRVYFQYCNGSYTMCPAPSTPRVASICLSTLRPVVFPQVWVWEYGAP